MKTQCPHCKSKFKAPDEYKGKKVKCHKCKELFVCIEPIEVTTTIKPHKAPIEVTEKCENCDRTIGKLEQSYIQKGAVVCGQCSEVLHPPVKISPKQPVYVTPTKSTSGFGVASLSLGIIACLGCWVPFCGFASLPLAAIGFLFGIIGIIVSKTTRRSFVGLPVAGTVVSSAAALIFIFVTGLTTTAIMQGVESVAVVDNYEKARESEEKSAYLSKVKITDLHVDKTVLGDLGTFGEVKNIGNRTLSEVEITVYYLNRYGEAIYEDIFHPVLTSSWSSDNKPLKPNYSKKFGYEADGVPSAWSKEIEVQVTNIEFAE